MIAQAVVPPRPDQVLKNWFFLRGDDQALYRHMFKEASGYLLQRKKEVAAIGSIAGWKKRQQWIRHTLKTAIGPFPERSPLNAKIVRSLKKDAYTVEHIIFESQPGFFVTASLFLPDSLQKKAPAIVYCSGHSATGYRPEPYQVAMINLVKKGFIVFAFDPVGQGERMEYLDEHSNSKVGTSTRQHDMPGVQAFITGSSQAMYMIWDGIRAVDYLVSRPEVDSLRIGMTGRSGGGTQTAFIAAFDDRIQAAAPECYITDFTRLLESLGPPDAEQNLPGIIKRGFDEPDLLAVRAPKPTLIFSTTNDYFNIQGARDTYHEVRRIYKAYNRESDINLSEDMAPHASTRKNREAMYSFFQQALHNPGSAIEQPVAQLTDNEMRVTATGQLSTSQQTASVYSLNAKRADELVNKLNRSRLKEDHLKKVVVDAKRLSGFVAPDTNDLPVAVGEYRVDGTVVQKFFIHGEGDYVIPYILFVPANPNGKGVLYLHPLGKSAVADSPAVSSLVLSLVKAGCYVLVPDLAGTGETGPGQWAGGNYFEHFPMKGLGYDLWYGAQLIGRSIAGIRAADVLKLVALLRKTGALEIAGIANRQLSPVLLHAAAFDKGIHRVVLSDPYTSYHSITGIKYYNPDFVEGTVPAALTAYDLPDLAASLAPGKLLMLNVTDGAGRPITDEENKRDLGIIRQSYARSPTGKLTITTGPDTRLEISEFFRDWGLPPVK